MKTLKDAKVGETVTVAKLHGEGAVKRRIMDMGITKGTEIFIRKVAPLGDPMELNVRGYCVCIQTSVGKAPTGEGVRLTQTLEVHIVLRQDLLYFGGVLHTVRTGFFHPTF